MPRVQFSNGRHIKGNTYFFLASNDSDNDVKTSNERGELSEFRDDTEEE